MLNQVLQKIENKKFHKDAKPGFTKMLNQVSQMIKGFTKMLNQVLQRC